LYLLPLLANHRVSRQFQQPVEYSLLIPLRVEGWVGLCGECLTLLWCTAQRSIKFTIRKTKLWLATDSRSSWSTRSASLPAVSIVISTTTFTAFDQVAQYLYLLPSFIAWYWSPTVMSYLSVSGPPIFAVDAKREPFIACQKSCNILYSSQRRTQTYHFSLKLRWNHRVLSAAVTRQSMLLCVECA